MLAFNGNPDPEAFVLAELTAPRTMMIRPRFAWWLLAEELPPRVLQHPNCAAALAGVAELYREWIETGDSISRDRWDTAREAAAYAANAAAYGVATYHANAPAPATVYATATATAYAAYAAANVAAKIINVANAAANAAAFAACTNANTTTYADAADTAHRQYWIRASDKLIELLAADACP
jgi:hypothetical protein